MTPRTDAIERLVDSMAGDERPDELLFEGLRTFERELALATEALAQREEELAAERRKNRELSSAIGKARELLRDSAGPFDEATMILAATTNP